MSQVISLIGVEQKIFLIRRHKVMLDYDLAVLYGVPTKRLNEQVKRNLKRFPDDFMFKVTAQEAQALRSQTVILESGPNLRSQFATSSYGGLKVFAVCFYRARDCHAFIGIK